MAERDGRGRSVFVYRVGAGEGIQDVISVMEHEWVSEHGLPTEAILGVIRRPQGFGDDVSPDMFEENPGFVGFLHELIAEHVLELRQVVRGAAGQDGAFIYLVDGRTTWQGGEVALQDVIGMVAVDAGGLVPGSYQPNPAHRLYTAGGFFVLPPELESVLAPRDSRARRPELTARDGPDLVVDLRPQQLAAAGSSHSVAFTANEKLVTRPMADWPVRIGFRSAPLVRLRSSDCAGGLCDRPR